MILFCDEVIITETPPLRTAWNKSSQALEVAITGNHDKRVLYGTLSMQGALGLYYAKKWDQDHFQAYLRQIRKGWRDWQIVLFLDRGSPHTVAASRQLARTLGIELRWLPTACPELNPVDHLWRHVKDFLVNEACPKVAEAVERASDYVLSLSPYQRLRKAGILSSNFWLKGPSGSLVVSIAISIKQEYAIG